jgi:hypothetical protein
MLALIVLPLFLITAGVACVTRRKALNQVRFEAHRIIDTAGNGFTLDQAIDLCAAIRRVERRYCEKDLVHGVHVTTPTGNTGWVYLAGGPGVNRD